MKMLLEILLILTVIALLVCLSLYFAPILLSPDSHNVSTGSVCINNNCFSVEIARTEVLRDRGLMYRTQLDKDKGMFFIFDKEGIYPFWMKNTLIPLDMIWIDGDNNIVFIGENIQPCKNIICPVINPLTNANYVLEVNAGITKDLGIKVGDIVNIKI
jgi:uncharacterized membrane protein (UPF0127 family)